MKKENRRLRLRLVIAAFGMFGFGFALVPFYKTICEVTGINRLLSADVPQNTQIDRNRTVTLEFDANSHGMPWRFHPLKSSLKVHPGELVRIDYEVENTTDTAITGQAIPSYGPDYTAPYVKKLDCFCFKQQQLAAHEKRVMPVVFILDPSLPKGVGTMTLSYTFFEVEGAARADAGSGGGKS